MQTNTPAADKSAIPLDTTTQVKKAIENALCDLATARHASHYLLDEVEGDWTHSVRADLKGVEANFLFTQSTLDARAWLAERVWTAVRDADEALPPAPAR